MRPAPLDCAAPGDLSFCTTGRAGAQERLHACQASMVIVDGGVLDGISEKSLSPLIVRSRNARLDFIRVLQRFFVAPGATHTLHPSAVIDPCARIGDAVSVGPLCTIADDVEVGPGTVIYAGVHIYPGVRIGARVVINSGTVIGAEGYGFERNDVGELERFPHLGGVVIEDDVEIGANVAIDRGALGNTWIGPRVRIDNLVHVAHNVQIEADVAIIAHAMLGGSALIGGQAHVAPCVSIREGIAVGARAVVGVGAVVTRPVAEGTTVLGNPARELSSHLAIQDAIKRLSRCAS
jgi:UDP-3-O-[3-hydroxymyristoyl] glucosamine N-acyltransferase